MESDDNDDESESDDQDDEAADSAMITEKDIEASSSLTALVFKELTRSESDPSQSSKKQKSWIDVVERNLAPDEVTVNELMQSSYDGDADIPSLPSMSVSGVADDRTSDGGDDDKENMALMVKMKMNGAKRMHDNVHIFTDERCLLHRVADSDAAYHFNERPDRLRALIYMLYKRKWDLRCHFHPELSLNGGRAPTVCCVVWCATHIVPNRLFFLLILVVVVVVVVEGY